jgi:hypothetical protein
MSNHPCHKASEIPLSIGPHSWTVHCRAPPGNANGRSLFEMGAGTDRMRLGDITPMRRKTGPSPMRMPPWGCYISEKAHPTLGRAARLAP